MFLAIAVMFFGASFAVTEVDMEIACQPPKFIPDVDKAPTVYYSIDSKQCDKVTGLLIVRVMSEYLRLKLIAYQILYLLAIKSARS